MTTERESACLNRNGSAKFRWPSRSQAKDVARKQGARDGVPFRVIGIPVSIPRRGSDGRRSPKRGHDEKPGGWAGTHRRANPQDARSFAHGRNHR